MKYLAVIALLFSVGCASKKRPEPKLAIPQKCILGGLVGSKCEALNKDEALCDRVVIKIACVEVKK